MAEVERIYTAEFPFVWRVLRRFGVQPEQLEDAVQDVFVVWVCRHEELGRRACARTCLYGIARRVAADSRRAAARLLRRHEALAAVASDSDDSFERDLETQSAVAAVERALAQLSEVQREAYLLAEVEGMSAQQIGEALEISPNTASSRLRLARQRLAAVIGEGRPLLAREEPPAETRHRVWAVIMPAWERSFGTPLVGAIVRFTRHHAPQLLVGTLYAGILGLAILPPTSAAPTPRRAPAVAAAAPVPNDMSEAPAPPAPKIVAAAGPPAPSRPAPARVRPPVDDPLAREARQIGAAQRLLQDGRIDEALAMLDTHAAEAPEGRLADEREALRAGARCRRGERDAALAAAAQWFAARPEATALATARALCRHEE